MNDDLARYRQARHRAAWITLMALDHITTRWADRRFIVETKAAGEARLSDRDVYKIEVLAWSYRRSLPRHLAPKLPYFDPVVRAMQTEIQA